MIALHVITKNHSNFSKASILLLSVSLPMVKLVLMIEFITILTQRDMRRSTEFTSPLLRTMNLNLRVKTAKPVTREK
jgi:hypothetical protein